MKIWVQSATAIGKDAEVASYDQSLRRHVREVVRSDTIVEVHGVDQAPPRPDKYLLSKLVQVSRIVMNARQAEKEGFDVFVVVCTLDPGFYEVRELLDIPVVFSLETSVLLACMLAPKFSFLTHNESLMLRIREKVKQYGLEERMTPGVYLDLSHKDFNNMYKNPKPYLDAFISNGRKVIEQGANIILVSGNPSHLFLLDHGVREIDGVPILDGCGASVKFGELMVDLKNIGIVRSKRGLYTAPSKEELSTLLKFLGM